MAVEIGDGGLGRIYLGDILIAGKPVTPPEEKYTATISWTENSTPGSINITYGGDAAGWAQCSNCWDKFFGYSAVLVDGSGTITGEVTQEDSGGYGCLNMCCLAAKGALSGGCNVMIKFPRMGYKMSKSGSTITACLTRCADASGFRYYAFNRGNGNLSCCLDCFCCGCYCACYTQPYMLLGAYKSTLGGGASKSWSGCTPDYGKTIDTFRNCSMANGTNYQQIGHRQRDLLNLYYVAKYGNLNSQAAIGCGYVNGSSRVVTGGTNSHPEASWGCCSNGTNQVKMFGLEDWRGNESEWVDGIYGKYVETTNAPACIAARATSGVWANTGVGEGSSGWISAVSGTDLGMFMPTGYSGGGTTYYSDCGYVCSSRVALAGGAWSNACAAGAFRLYVGHSPSYCYSAIGSRLMYL